MEGHTIFKWYKLNSVIVDFLSQIYHEKMNELSGFIHLSKKPWNKYMSHLVEKPTMWFPTRSDTNRPVQLQKQARSLKFWS